jgi:hypothetical protein
MRSFVTKLAWYFGIRVGDGPPPAMTPRSCSSHEPLRLERARRSLLEDALLVSLLAVFAGALVLAWLDWSVREVVLGTATGAFLWGSFYFFIEVRQCVPEGSALLSAPADAVFDERDWLRSARAALWVLPLCVGLAWLADRWDLGGVFVPGQFAGVVAAKLAGVILVSRWEREHGDCVLRRLDGCDEAELYGAARSRPLSA